MEKLFLHSCCGPCSTHVIDLLSAEYDVTVFYYNPNILPEEEYLLRRSEQERFIKEYSEKTGRKISYIEGDYLPDLFKKLVSGRESEREGGERCRICMAHRLDVTARCAKELGYGIFCTTLSVSPYKPAAFLNDTGKALSEKYEIEYLVADFKKKDGYKHSVEMSKEYGLYRQHYCGCNFPVEFTK